VLFMVVWGDMLRQGPQTQASKSRVCVDQMQTPVGPDAGLHRMHILTAATTACGVALLLQRPVAALPSKLRANMCSVVKRL